MRTSWIVRPSWRVSAAVLGIAFSGCELRAEQRHTLQVIVQQPGIYQANMSGLAAAKGTLGPVRRVSNAMLVQSTTAIPALKSVRFGFRYLILGWGGGIVELTLITRFPASGLLNPHSGVRHFENTYVVNRAVGSVGYRDYYLDESWEMVPGRWSLEFWHQGRKVGEQEFCLFEPSAAQAKPNESPADCQSIPRDHLSHRVSRARDKRELLLPYREALANLPR